MNYINEKLLKCIINEERKSVSNWTKEEGGRQKRRIIRTKRDFYSEGIFLGHLSKLLREGGHVKGEGEGSNIESMLFCVLIISGGERLFGTIKEQLLAVIRI